MHKKSSQALFLSFDFFKYISSTFRLRPCSDKSTSPVNLEIINKNVFQLYLPARNLLSSMMDPFENYRGSPEKDE